MEEKSSKMFEDWEPRSINPVAGTSESRPVPAISVSDPAGFRRFRPFPSRFWLVLCRRIPVGCFRTIPVIFQSVSSRTFLEPIGTDRNSPVLSGQESGGQETARKEVIPVGSDDGSMTWVMNDFNWTRSRRRDFNSAQSCFSMNDGPSHQLNNLENDVQLSKAWLLMMPYITTSIFQYLRSKITTNVNHRNLILCYRKSVVFYRELPHNCSIPR